MNIFANIFKNRLGSKKYIFPTNMGELWLPGVGAPQSQDSTVSPTPCSFQILAVCFLSVTYTME